MRIRRYDNRAITVGFLQCLVLGLIKGEIGDPVVNEIDRLSVDAELTIVVAKVTGVGDDRGEVLDVGRAVDAQVGGGGLRACEGLDVARGGAGVESEERAERSEE